MEKIIHKQMFLFLDSNELIYNFQHGFVRKLSTVTNVLHSVTDWAFGIDAEKTLILYF